MAKPGEKRWNEEAGVFEIYKGPPISNWVPVGPDFDRLQPNLSSEERTELRKLLGLNP